jgi:hypothetical protein
VVIDLRSEEDVILGGVIARAIPMDPDFLDNSDGLAKWIQVMGDVM